MKWEVTTFRKWINPQSNSQVHELSNALLVINPKILTWQCMLDHKQDNQKGNRFLRKK